MLYGVTAPVTARTFLRGQLAHLASEGWAVHLICGEPGAEQFASAEGVDAMHMVPAARQPSWRDPITLWRLWWRISRLRPDVVVMGTPKVGVLGTLAGFLARVPRRIYLIHGYRAEGLSGPLRSVMRTLEWAGCAAATDVIAVSESLQRKLLDEGVVQADKVQVLGPGSANGLDLTRFRPPTGSEVVRERVTLGLPPDATVLANVGRLTADKGLQQLPELWRRLSDEDPSFWFVIAGEPELASEADASALAELRALPRVRIVGHVEHIERVYRASDLLLLLSRREGLGMVALEAAACGVPTVAWRVTGVVDAVVDGETGRLVTFGDRDSLLETVKLLLTDVVLRQALGSAAARRAADQFDQRDVWERWAQLLAPSTTSRRENEVPS